ncbi:glycosyltransferase family 2 protein [Opitutales bacterium]|nr:glycosyltransferase family 2 protein [Opitutales bacterium]
MTPLDLAVIIPTYNEGIVAKLVVEEWFKALRNLEIPKFTLFLIDDGSTDDTAKIVSSAKVPKENLIVCRKPNSGHGRSCIWGYAKALSLNPKWILQIDSDFQCDPKYFKKFWLSKKDHEVIYGFRKTREDGISRLIISRIISIFVFLSTFKYCRDPNVPYRMFSKNALSKVIEKTYEIELSNMLLTYRVISNNKIFWVDINFRDRMQGKSTHKLRKAISSLIELIWTVIHDKE